MYFDLCWGGHFMKYKADHVISISSLEEEGKPSLVILERFNISQNF